MAAMPADAMGGMTALHFSAREGQINVIRELVGAGADVNKVNGADGISVMTMAIINGHLDIAKFLLDNGANSTLASDTGLTPLYATIDSQWAARTWYPPASIEEEEIGYLDLHSAVLSRSQRYFHPQLERRGHHPASPPQRNHRPDHPHLYLCPSDRRPFFPFFPFFLLYLLLKDLVL